MSTLVWAAFWCILLGAAWNMHRWLRDDHPAPCYGNGHRVWEHVENYAPGTPDRRNAVITCPFCRNDCLVVPAGADSYIITFHEVV